MTDQLLPPDDLRAIEARAENWQDLNLDFLAFQDIPALLAHIRAQDAELARLREERAPSCQNGCLLMVKCHDVEEYYEDKSDATNT